MPTTSSVTACFSAKMKKTFEEFINGNWPRRRAPAAT